MDKKFDYTRHDDPIYINRARQQRGYETINGWLAAVFFVFVMIWFGALVYRAAELLA